MTCLGVISGATKYQPPLPSYKVGKRLQSILGQFKVGIEWFVNVYLAIIFIRGTVEAHIAKGVGLDTKRLVYGMQGDNSTTKVGGTMEVAMSSLGLVLNYVVLVLGNESGGPQHMQGCHALDL